MKVARSISVCTPRRGTYTLTMLSLCSQEQVVSTRKLASPPGEGPAPPAGLKPPMGQAGLGKPRSTIACAPEGGIHAAAATGAATCQIIHHVSSDGQRAQVSPKVLAAKKLAQQDRPAACRQVAPPPHS